MRVAARSLHKIRDLDLGSKKQINFRTIQKNDQEGLETQTEAPSNDAVDVGFGTPGPILHGKKHGSQKLTGRTVSLEQRLH